MFDRFSQRVGLLIVIFLSGCITTEIDERPRASTYGMEDPSMALLVVRDNSAGFNIASVALKGVDVPDEYNWGAVPEYEDGLFEIKPGHYTVFLEYYGKTGSVECKGSVMGDFVVAAGLAVGYSMANGSVDGCSQSFEPPEAIDITDSLEKPDPPIVSRTINRTGTLCILSLVLFLVLVVLVVVYLSWRNERLA